MNKSVFARDFPILNGIHYLDNAATTQKPKIVIDSMNDYYSKHNANTHRGLYKLSEEATQIVYDSRATIAKFINADVNEIIFVRNTTEGMNQLANSIEKTLLLNPESNIVTTAIEHHSNFVPWQQLCLRTGAEFRIASYDAEIQNIHDIVKLVDDETVLVAITAMSNVSGLMMDLNGIISRIRQKNPTALIVVDAAQAVAHQRIDVKHMDADFLAFSAHKIYGPTGIGVVYGKKRLLEKIQPFFYGGNMVNSVSEKETTWADIPEKFEAGTLDGAGIYATAAAISYFEKNFDELVKVEHELQKYLVEQLKKVDGLRIIGHNSQHYGPVVSFIVDKIHPHDLATICDKHNVCVRAGHHCAQLFMKSLGEVATTRASISFYNTKEDIDKLIYAILDAKKIFGEE